MKIKILLAVAFLFVQHTIIQAQTDLATFTDLDEAKIHATQNRQAILMVFAGSDWCKPCIQFKKDILQSNDFADRLGNTISVLYLDFPARRKNKLPKAQTEHNEALAERFNKSGAFPKIVLIDTNENVLGSLPFNGQTPLDFAYEAESILNKKL